jgi:ABC-type sulfate/molybdate transport systems ATPase subunit
VLLPWPPSLPSLGPVNDKSTVVLDDPVSSLDHERRNIVAHRLAECARDRQVIFFTHDLVFVHMLKAAAGKHGVGVTDREIRRVGTTAGYCRNKTPAKAMTVKALVGELKAHQQECAPSIGTANWTPMSGTSHRGTVCYAKRGKGLSRNSCSTSP